MNITTEKLRPRDWAAIDSDSYDGSPDSITNFIGRGETEEEAIEDLKAMLTIYAALAGALREEIAKGMI